MNLSKLIQDQQLKLKQQLDMLDKNNVSELIRQKESLLKQIAEIDEKLKHICSEIGVDFQQATGQSEAQERTRSRMSSGEVRTRIIAVLEENRAGVSQIEISEKSKISYPCVAAFIKRNANLMRIEGALKNKKVFLK